MEKVGNNKLMLISKYERYMWEKLTADGIIYNKRGIGYFTSSDAREIILEAQRREFIENELPAVLKRMHLLGLDPKEFIK